ncbi:MAG: DUF2062 domain-containing protein [Acidobacteriota bacterium]
MPPENDYAAVERRHRAERAGRFGRLRRLLKPLPRRTNLSRYPVIRHFAAAARRYPDLWSFREGPIRKAIYAGAVIACLPIYGLQILLGLGVAIVLRANLAVMCAFQLVTNPLTAGPIYYAAYRTGIWFIRTFEIGHGLEAMGTRFNALVLGGVLIGLCLGLLGDLVYRFAVWEARQFKKRHAAARERAAAARAVTSTRARAPALGEVGD